MKGAALVLFRGDVFPYHVLNKAVEWSQQHGAEMQVLFLEEGPPKEGYVFPSDMDAAETLKDESDVEAINEKILQRKIKRVKDTADDAGIACSIKVSHDVSADTVLTAADEVDIIFADGGQGHGTGEPEATLPYSLKGYPDRSPVPVELITAE